MSILLKLIYRVSAIRVTVPWHSSQKQNGRKYFQAVQLLRWKNSTQHPPPPKSNLKSVQLIWVAMSEVKIYRWATSIWNHQGKRNWSHSEKLSHLFVWLKNKKDSDSGEDVEKGEFSYTIDGNVNQCSPVGNWSFLRNLEPELPYGPTVALWVFTSKEKEAGMSKRCLPSHVYCCTAQTAMVWSWPECSIGGWVDKEHVVTST